MRGGCIAQVVRSISSVNHQRGGTSTARLKSGAANLGQKSSAARRDFRPTSLGQWQRNPTLPICHLPFVISNSPIPPHHYSLTTVWTGNTGKGTSTYRDYERIYEGRIPQKPILLGSSDPKYRGDPTRYNPEDLLVASLSACHMLWYLHLCSDKKIICTHYSDAAEGEMETSADGNGRFTKVVLHPEVVITSEDGLKVAHDLHERAHALCFIANSVNFPIEVSATIGVAE